MKAVMVRTLAFVDVSDVSARRMQTVSPNTYGYFCHRAHSSCGRPRTRRRRSDTARLSVEGKEFGQGKTREERERERGEERERVKRREKGNLFLKVSVF